MYHLFVTSNKDAWRGEPYVFPIERCLREREYTDSKLVVRYGSLTPELVNELVQYPCIFAYENGCELDARLGRLIEVRKKGGEVRIAYELNANYPPIAHNDLTRLEWELGIEGWELNRMHWALKDEALSEALASIGYPQIGISASQIVDVHNHTFDVALSFPGEVREYVQLVASNLVSSLGRDKVFYDNFYKGQLARPNLDTALQAIYKNQSKLIVAFLSKDYSTKKWCHLEFRAIKEIIHSKDDARVMFVRHDGEEVDGVFSTDGYIDATTHNPNQVAEMICERVALLARSNPNIAKSDEQLRRKKKS